ncbi:hypothetical protein B4U84_28320 [Westiellopsis prolifica IICB1]|nr:hypothetical protein B4U84_28320 [Westiellopsis prolifica IICB1]
MIAVVHHGGGGTTINSIRAGVPVISIPYGHDHFFWSHRVADLGLGLRPIRQKQLSDGVLADAIQAVINDKAMQARVAAMGKKIQAENGVIRAIEILDRYLSSNITSL